MDRDGFIVLSDLHLHIWKNHNEDNRRTSAHIQVLLEIWHRGLEENRIIFFAGDFIHKGTEVSMELLRIIINTCLAMRVMKAEYPDSDLIKIYAIDGNHDQDASNRWDSRANNIIQILAMAFPDIFVDMSNSCTPLEVGEYHFYGLSYFRYNDGLETGIQAIRDNPHYNKKKLNVLFIHTVLPGSTDTDGRAVEQDGKPIASVAKTFKGFDLVLCGHIHKHYSFGGGIYNIGAPIQQRLTDMGSKMGYMLIEGENARRVVLKGYPEFKMYEGDKPPDDKHFWVKMPEEKTVTKTSITAPKTQSMKSLVRGYKKAMKVNGKDEELARLIILLEGGQDD